MFKKGFIFALIGFLFWVTQVSYADLADPTQPPFAFSKEDAISTAKLDLTAIFSSGLSNIAVINGQFLQVGGTVANYQVTQITKDAVYLQGPSGKIALPLINIKVKTPVMDGVITK